MTLGLVVIVLSVVSATCHGIRPTSRYSVVHVTTVSRQSQWQLHISQHSSSHFMAATRIIIGKSIVVSSLLSYYQFIFALYLRVPIHSQLDNVFLPIPSVAVLPLHLSYSIGGVVYTLSVHCSQLLGWARSFLRCSLSKYDMILACLSRFFSQVLLYLVGLNSMIHCLGVWCRIHRFFFSQPSLQGSHDFPGGTIFSLSPPVPVTSPKQFLLVQRSPLYLFQNFRSFSSTHLILKKWYPRENGCRSHFLLKESLAGTGNTKYKSKHLYLTEISIQGLTSSNLGSWTKDLTKAC